MRILRPLLCNFLKFSLLSKLLLACLQTLNIPRYREKLGDENQDAGNQKKAVCQKNLIHSHLKNACNINRVLDKGMSAQETCFGKPGESRRIATGEWGVKAEIEGFHS